MEIRKMGTAFVARLEPGDEVLQELRAWADEQGVGFASVTAIGALERATLGYFEPQEKEYRHVPVEEQVEVLALNGSITRGEQGEPVVHVHVLLGREDTSTLGGHLMEGIVRPTLEVVLAPLPGEVRRRQDPETGLVLWDLS